MGAAVGVSDYLSMVVSTGVGGGIVLDGRLLDGATGNAGHIGHVIVEPGGRRCACGAQGCLEAEASGTAIAAITGRPPAEAGSRTWSRAPGGWSARPWPRSPTCSTCAWPRSPARWPSASGPPFFAAAQAELDARARLPFSVGCRIVPSGLGAAGPLVGAAAVGWRGTGRPRPMIGPRRELTGGPSRGPALGRPDLWTTGRGAGPGARPAGMVAALAPAAPAPAGLPALPAADHVRRPRRAGRRRRPGRLPGMVSPDAAPGAVTSGRACVPRAKSSGSRRGPLAVTGGGRARAAMTQALVLNATYEPLCVVPSRRALMLVLDGKAELLHATDGMFRAERVAFAEPSVVRLGYYVKVPYQARVALNRRAVFARDGHRCQYCGASAENIDHVIPQQQGRPPRLGQRGRRLPAVQHPQAGPAARGQRHAAAPPPRHPARADVDPGRQRHHPARLGALPRADGGVDVGMTYPPVIR